MSECENCVQLRKKLLIAEETVLRKSSTTFVLEESEKLRGVLGKIERLIMKIPHWPDREGEGKPHICLRCDALAEIRSA